MPNGNQPDNDEYDAHETSDWSDDEDRDLRSLSKVRVIDWLRTFSLVLTVPVVGFFAGLLIGYWFNSAALSLAIIGTTLALIPTTLVVQLLGFVLDPTADRLAYPVIFYRRSVPISEIRDANCQTITRRSTSNPGRVIGESRTRSRSTKVYAVNISGDFGVRSLRFSAKYKRDQFLSCLRNTAPHCRITRWT
jgi:hypothetical protein